MNKKLVTCVVTATIAVIGLTGCSPQIEAADMPLDAIYESESHVFSVNDFSIVTETGHEPLEKCTLENLFAPYKCKTADGKYELEFHVSKNSQFISPKVFKDGKQADYHCAEPVFSPAYCIPNK